jgi:DNA-binding MarR family transcriptional regulator
METSRDQTVETLLVSVNRLIRTAAQAAGSTTSSAVWRTLGILETDQPLRLGELAAASRVAQPTMTRLVAGMLADGLISRTVDPDDSRGQLIEITEAGHTRLVEWRATLTSTVGPLFADLDDDAWDVLHEAAAIIASRTSTRPTAAATTHSITTGTEITA